MDDADAADTTITNAPPPPRRKATKRPAPDEPQQALGRKLRASTVAKSAAALEALVSLKPPPPRRRAPKRALTDVTVESAADAAQPASLLQQDKLQLQVVTRRPRQKTGWKRENGKSKEEKAAYLFLRASDDEFRRLYALYVACVEGELTLDEQTRLLVEGLFSGFKELHEALAEVEEVHPTDERLGNITKCALHLSQAAKAVASNEITGGYFAEAISVVSGAALRGYSPAKALAEFDKHLDVVTAKRDNREAYLKITAEEGRYGRGKHGGNVIVDAKKTVAIREHQAELDRKTAAGEREPRHQGATMATHARAVKALADNEKNDGRNRLRRIGRALKATGIATPKDCIPAQALGDGGVPLFRTDSRLVPEGADNRPRIAEEAAARAVQHRAEKGKKTRAEIAADRRARLPDNVRPSVAKSRAGQYYVAFPVNKSCPSYAIRKLAGTTGAVSVVKPGTDGFYPSTKAAAEVRDEWIELKRPESWLTKRKN